MTGQELYEKREPAPVRQWHSLPDDERGHWITVARIASQEPAPSQRVGGVIGCVDPQAEPEIIYGPNWRPCVDCGNGFKPRFFAKFYNLVTRCPECSETWALAAQPKPRSRTAIDRWRDVCPAIYQETELAQIPVHRRRPLFWGETQTPTKLINQTGGLLITGDSRLQKTRVMWLLIKYIFVRGGYGTPSGVPSFRFFDAIDFGLEWADVSGEFKSKKFVDGVASADLVFFDDLGKAELSATARAALFGVIEKRCAAKLPILATTNCTGETLAAGMDGNRGAPFVERLREFCDCYKFTASETVGPV